MWNLIYNWEALYFSLLFFRVSHRTVGKIHSLVCGGFICVGLWNSRYRPDIAYDGSPKHLSTFGSDYRSCIVNYVCIISINCAKKSKKWVFSHFLEFGISDWLGMAYYVNAKWFLTSNMFKTKCAFILARTLSTLRWSIGLFPVDTANLQTCAYPASKVLV